MQEQITPADLRAIDRLVDEVRNKGILLPPCNDYRPADFKLKTGDVITTKWSLVAGNRVLTVTFSRLLSVPSWVLSRLIVWWGRPTSTFNEKCQVVIHSSDITPAVRRRLYLAPVGTSPAI